MAGLFCALDPSVAVLIPGFGWVEGLSIGGKRTVQLRWHPLENPRRGLTQSGELVALHTEWRAGSASACARALFH